MTATATLEPLSVGNLLSIDDLTRDDILKVFATAAQIKAKPEDYRDQLLGQTLVLIFEKPSLRTRCTFEIGIAQLGGHAVFLDHQKVKLGERESIRDVASNLGRWAHGIVARTYKNKSVSELAEHARIPVINGLTDLLHPCQGLTDLFTVSERFGTLDGLKVAYVGDGNNTCHSLMYGCSKLGVDLTVITPEGYEPNSRVANAAGRTALEQDCTLKIENDPAQIEGCQVVYTDTWVSMGQETETEERIQTFAPYKVNTELMERAHHDAVFLHCLPAHRGAEVDANVIDSDCSLVYEQAENRLHVQKSLMVLLMGAHTGKAAHA